MERFARRDLVTGLLFVALGGAFAVHAWLTLSIGDALQMGPGYFPVVLGGLLAALGVAIVLGARDGEATARPPVPWRGILLVTGAVVVFGFAVRGLGFAPTLAISSTMAAFAPRDARPASALLLAALLTAFSTLVFVLLLRLPYPVVGPWLGG